MTFTIRTPTRANRGVMPYERFYGVKPDVGHIRTFGCIVRVTLPSEKLGKLEDRRAMGYLMGYKYEGGYRVWIPHIGMKEVRDVTFYEGTAPMCPTMGRPTRCQRSGVQVVKPPKTTPGPVPPHHQHPRPYHRTKRCQQEQRRGEWGGGSSAAGKREKLTRARPLPSACTPRCDADRRPQQNTFRQT